jgi:hypothetical protein
MAHKVFDLVKEHSDTTGPAKTVLLLIADHAGAEDGSGARLGEERLAVEAGLSVRTVQRAITEAEQLEELEVERGRRSRGRQAVNRYRVRVEVLQSKPGVDVRLERLQAERAAVVEATRRRASARQPDVQQQDPARQRDVQPARQTVVLGEGSSTSERRATARQRDVQPARQRDVGTPSSEPPERTPSAPGAHAPAHKAADPPSSPGQELPQGLPESQGSSPPPSGGDPLPAGTSQNGRDVPLRDERAIRAVVGVRARLAGGNGRVWSFPEAAVAEWDALAASEAGRTALQQFLAWYLAEMRGVDVRDLARQDWSMAGQKVSRWGRLALYGVDEAVTRDLAGIDFWKYVEAVCRKASTEGPRAAALTTTHDPDEQLRLDREHNEQELARVRAMRSTDPGGLT